MKTDQQTVDEFFVAISPPEERARLLECLRHQLPAENKGAFIWQAKGNDGLDGPDLERNRRALNAVAGR